MKYCNFKYAAATLIVLVAVAFMLPKASKMMLSNGQQVGLSKDEMLAKLGELGDVTMYSNPGCPYCEIQKKAIRSLGVTHIRIIEDTSKFPEDLEGVPHFIKSDGSTHTGLLFRFHDDGTYSYNAW